MARSYFTVATFNLRNLVNPGVTYYQTNSYSEAAFSRKIAWLAEQLYRMDADFVGCQEVFHAEAFQALADAYEGLVAERDGTRASERKRYSEVWHLPNAQGSAADPSPGVGFLSRAPILEKRSRQDLAADPIEVADIGGLDYRLTQLSRPQQFARVTLAEGHEGWIANAHLKSKRPLFAAGSSAGVEANAEFLERATGSLRSLVLRAGEALALRREVIALMEGTTTPVIVVGDLNDDVGAVTTEMVRGEAPFRGLPIDVKALFWDVELHSAARIQLRRSEGVGFFTNIYNGHYSTIDHILVSQEFYYRNARAIGDVAFVRCLNDHLTDSSLTGAPGLGAASDHGQITARLWIDI